MWTLFSQFEDPYDELASCPHCGTLSVCTSFVIDGIELAPKRETKNKRVVSQALKRNTMDNPSRVGTRLKDRRLFACPLKTKALTELAITTMENRIIDPA